MVDSPKKASTPERPPGAFTFWLGVVVLLAVVIILLALIRSENRTPQAQQRDNLQALRKTDPAVILYRESTRFETGFRESRGIAIGPDGNRYVVGDHGLHIFREDGKQIKAVELDIAPTCLAVAADGTIYIGTRDHVVLVNGTHKSDWQSLGKKAYITSIAVADKDVWVADAGNRIVCRYDRVGTLRGRIGKRSADTGAPGLVAPSPHLDVSALPDGTVWVANPGRHELEAFGADGKLKTSWGSAGTNVESFCGCCNPTDFALLPDGRFITSEKGLPRVKVYNAKGTFQGVVAGPESFTPDVAGLDIAVDRRGRVLVLDPAENVVRVYEETGHEK